MKEWQKIYDTLKNEIINNKYDNQKYLPTEQKLCIKFKVSRETIRKVYSNLENDGVLWYQSKIREELRNMCLKILFYIHYYQITMIIL